MTNTAVSLSIGVQTTLNHVRFVNFHTKFVIPSTKLLAERDEDHDTKREQALSVTFLQSLSDWFDFSK